MRRVLRIAILAGGLWPNVANASPITLNVGDVSIFNWNFATRGVSPTPYPAIGILVQPGSVGGGDTFSTALLSGLDATGSKVSGTLNFDTVATNNPELTDGIFSLQIAVTAGSITVDPVAFVLSRVAVQLSPISGPVAPLSPTPVPKPASLALLGSGIAGVAVLCRKRKQQIQ